MVSLDKQVAMTQKAILGLTPTDEELKAQRLEYLKKCQPKMLKKLRRAGTLNSELESAAKATRERVASLMESGEFEAQAWSRAIRSEILDSDLD